MTERPHLVVVMTHGPEDDVASGRGGVCSSTKRFVRSLTDARPSVISSIMGLFPPKMVAQMNALGVFRFATVTTVEEAVLAEAAGADVIIAQGMEAGGHRGAFKASGRPRRRSGCLR